MSKSRFLNSRISNSRILNSRISNYKCMYFLKSLLTLFSCEWHAISSADDEVVDSSANSLGGLAIVVVEAEDAVVEAKIEPWEAQCPLNREKNHCNK